MVLKLSKALFGLKQFTREWNETLGKTAEIPTQGHWNRLGFVKCVMILFFVVRWLDYCYALPMDPDRTYPLQSIRLLNIVVIHVPLIGMRARGSYAIYPWLKSLVYSILLWVPMSRLRIRRTCRCLLHISPRRDLRCGCVFWILCRCGLWKLYWWPTLYL